MIAIYDSNRSGFAGILVDTDKKQVIQDLVKLTDGWAAARDYKRRLNIRGATQRIPRIFPGFENIEPGVLADGSPAPEGTFTERTTVVQKYNIATRFEFMDELIQMVIAGVAPSCIITGPGGIGKTYSVVEALKSQHYKDDEYKTVKGFTTPMGLYYTLFDNKNGIIVFDDCDSAFKDQTALNILKGALDSCERRIISWNSSRLPPDLPASFEFRGRILFVSNLPIRAFDQTLISRSMIIDLQMSREEILSRIDAIKEKIAPAPVDAREDVIKFLKDRKDSMGDLNIRTYIKVLKIRLHAKKERWESMADFMACS